jgi:hypothetical protein
MSDSDDFTAMSDPDFLAERKRVRETLEALTERYRVINIEFDRRAGAKWACASQGLSRFPACSRSRTTATREGRRQESPPGSNDY